jgi:hypothetical protein
MAWHSPPASVRITPGVQLRGPEGAQRPRASSAATAEFGGDASTFRLEIITPQVLGASSGLTVRHLSIGPLTAIQRVVYHGDHGFGAH